MLWLIWLCIKMHVTIWNYAPVACNLLHEMNNALDGKSTSKNHHTLFHAVVDLVEHQDARYKTSNKLHIGVNYSCNKLHATFEMNNALDG